MISDIVIVSTTEDAGQRDIFDLALGRIVREQLECRGLTVRPDDPDSRPSRDGITPRLIRARIERWIEAARSAGLGEKGEARLRRIVENDLTWNVGTETGVRLGELNDRLAR